MPDVLVVGANLLFLSKIQEAAKALGLVAEPVALDSALQRSAEPRVIIVDLEKVPVSTAAGLVRPGGCRVVGFASHGEAGILESARSAGLSPMSKGQLASQLPEILGVP